MAKKPVTKQRKVEIKDLKNPALKNLNKDQLRKLTGGKDYQCPGDCDTLEVHSSFTTHLSVSIKKARSVRAVPR